MSWKRFGGLSVVGIPGSISGIAVSVPYFLCKDSCGVAEEGVDESFG